MLKLYFNTKKTRSLPWYIRLQATFSAAKCFICNILPYRPKSEGSPCPPPIIVKKGRTPQWGSFFLPHSTSREKSPKAPKLPLAWKTTKFQNFPLREKWVPPLPHPSLVGVPPLHNYAFMHRNKKRRREGSAWAKYNGNVVFLRVVNDCSLPRLGNQ